MERSEELVQALSRFIDQQPFFAVLLTQLLQVHESDAVPTAGTDGVNLFVNPKFFNRLTLDERLFILGHEVLHVIMEHPSRTELYVQRGFGPDLKPFDAAKMNVAQDYVINDMLVQSGFKAMPVGGYLNPQYGADRLTDDVYCELPDDHKPKQPKGKPGSGGSGNTGGFDEHMPPAPGTVDAPQPSKADIQRALKSAEAAARSVGKLPACLERLVNEVCEPQVDWASELRVEISTNAGRDGATWARPNRKRLAVYPHVFLPGTSGHRAGCIAIYGDTSGSVQDKEWSHYFGEAAAIVDDLNPMATFIGSCDVEATDPLLIATGDDVRSYKPVGGGGTHMPAIFDKLAESDIVPDTLVILTDGYTDFGSPPGYPVIWVITTPEIVAPHGKTIHIKVH